MRKLICCLLLVVSVFSPLSAGTFDLGLTLGTNSHFGEKGSDVSKMKLAWGVTLGLTDLWELELQANSSLIPRFFGDTSFVILAQKAMLGQRSTGGKVAGLGINSLLGAGIMVSNECFDGEFLLPTHLLLSVTPMSVGNPISCKRERALAVTLAYNVFTSQVSVLFDLIKYDFYLVGTYKDYL
ncbi:hypothetical protein [Sphaerochaeta sp. PS]|uniref:hypothetical protein n=1 Tax=Sphaerochaeta sp. PS TaxID=3076336 RepID=UPI0028A464C9|nr:hypothetical protein [Sphaerochaeta sp. PS]MDT4761385.1 hypothetical protein [Sphaerochaeta sp. PS]